MTDKPTSTYEREMKDPAFRKKYEKEYEAFLLSERALALSQEDQTPETGD